MNRFGEMVEIAQNRLQVGVDRCDGSVAVLKRLHFLVAASIRVLFLHEK